MLLFKPLRAVIRKPQNGRRLATSCAAARMHPHGCSGSGVVSGSSAIAAGGEWPWYAGDVAITDSFGEDGRHDQEAGKSRRHQSRCRVSRDAVRMALQVLEAEMTVALDAEKGDRWRAARDRSGHTARR